MSDLSSSSCHGFFKNVHTSSGLEDYKNTPSPTSILDAKSSPETSSFANPFERSPTIKSGQKPAEAIGLALIDDSFVVGGQEAKTATSSSSPSPSKAVVVDRMLLLGSKLKVQIPAIDAQTPAPPAESPRSPADFGIKTRPQLVAISAAPTKEFRRQLSLKEMELSEDYTCVITHGPNPKTTHIFDDCVVGGDLTDVSSAEFVGFCGACKKVLGHDKEIHVCLQGW